MPRCCRPRLYEHASSIPALGLIVRPSAAACLLGPVGGAFINQSLPWSEVTGELEAQRLAEAVQQGVEVAFCLQMLVASFGRAMAAVPPEHWKNIEQLCEAVGHHGARAGDMLGIGRRQLERRCRSVLGMSPKQFERLERFHGALTSVVTQEAASLAGESLDAGYYDQSHFALEARQFAGASVREMTSQAAPDTPWWPLSTPRGLQRQNPLPLS